jgi:hypothetical protein
METPFSFCGYPAVVVAPLPDLIVAYFKFLRSNFYFSGVGCGLVGGRRNVCNVHRFAMRSVRRNIAEYHRRAGYQAYSFSREGHCSYSRRPAKNYQHGKGQGA